MPVHFVGDAQWGSCGKGLLAGALALKYKLNRFTSTNHPNAGHTCVVKTTHESVKFVSHVLPACTNAFAFTGGSVIVVLGPSAVFDLNTLALELEQLKRHVIDVQVWVHERAMALDRKYTETEANIDQRGRIGSTGRGAGAANAAKVLRSALVVSNDEATKDRLLKLGCRIIDSSGMAYMLNQGHWLHEGSQGFGLSLEHGTSYPFCTSRNCTPAQAFADLAVHPRNVGHRVLCFRPFPIRVGGNSGPAFRDDQIELDWSDIKRRCGAPESVDLTEYTTTTNRMRRVFEFNEYQLLDAVQISGATGLFLNFAQHIDYTAIKAERWSDLPQSVLNFVERVENRTKCRVWGAGIGPHSDVDVLWSPAAPKALYREKLVYVAAPYRASNGKSVAENVSVARLLVNDLLREHDADFVLPHNMSEGVNGGDSRWMPAVTNLLTRCDALFCQPELGMTAGVLDEIAQAHAMGVPVFHSHEQLDNWLAAQ